MKKCKYECENSNVYYVKLTMFMYEGRRAICVGIFYEKGNQLMKVNIQINPRYLGRVVESTFDPRYTRIRGLFTSNRSKV